MALGHLKQQRDWLLWQPTSPSVPCNKLSRCFQACNNFEIPIYLHHPDICFLTFHFSNKRLSSKNSLYLTVTLSNALVLKSVRRRISSLVKDEPRVLRYSFATITLPTKQAQIRIMTVVTDYFPWQDTVISQRSSHHRELHNIGTSKLKKLRKGLLWGTATPTRISSYTPCHTHNALKTRVNRIQMSLNPWKTYPELDSLVVISKLTSFASASLWSLEATCSRFISLWAALDSSSERATCSRHFTTSPSSCWMWNLFFSSWDKIN